MSGRTTQWILELIDNITAPLRAVQGAADDAAESVENIDENLGNVENRGGGFSELGARIGASAFAFNQISDAVGKLTGAFRNAVAPGADFEYSLSELSAVTQKSGDDLNAMGDSAKGLAEKFGGHAVDFVESYKDIIGSLGDGFVESDALALMGENVGILSKLMGGDAKSAANALSTAMLQYGVDLSNPTEAAKEATRMMNVMQAAANAGGSEVSDTAEALRQSGLLARQSGLSFEELNASLEGLALGKITGGEAGTAMRNILLSMSTLGNASKETIEGLKKYGVNLELISNPAVKFTDRLRELQKIQGDSGLMENVFMKANIAAGQTILNNIDAIDEYTVAIGGTNAAVEGAAVIMDTYNERMSRTHAWLENLKIGFFDVITPIAPFITITGEAVSGLVSLGGAVEAVSILFKKSLYVGIWSGIKSMGLFIARTLAGAAASVFFAITSGKAFAAFSTAVSVACRVVGAAIMSIPILGWIAAVVAALIALGVYFYNTSAEFRGFLWGLWEAVKAVFSGIGSFISEVMDGVWYLIKGVFNPLNWFDDDYKFSAGLAKITDAASKYGESIGKAFQEGKAAGKADFDKSDADGEEVFPLEPEATKVGAIKRTNVEKHEIEKVKNVNKKQKKTDEPDGLKLAGTGAAGGGKSITMNLTINNYFNGLKNIDEAAEKIVRQINDRLNDALAVG